MQQRKGENREVRSCILSEGLGFDVTACFYFLFFLCQNFVVAVGAEGWFHLFDLTAAAASKADSSSQHEFQSPDDQKPFLTQHIPANTKVILISDIGKFSLNSSVINVDFCDF